MTDEQRLFYETFGYLVLPDALSPAELAAAREASARAEAPSHTGWHHDVSLAGVYHPRSTLMVKLFFLLEDVAENGGCTLFLPGSHRYPMDFPLPKVGNPAEMPGHVKMAFPAGTAYFFNGRLYHSATDNDSDSPRRVLIYNYGHHWMKIWPGYEPSERLRSRAETPVRKQLLGMGDAYRTSLRPT